VNANVQIAADRDVCIGAGICVVTAPAVFDQDEEGIVVVLAEEVLDSEVGRAIELCPSGALRLLDPDDTETEA
jgi:ferredoxin